MTAPIIAFFNNKGGVGKTTLVYHLSWMLAELGKRVVAADLDPQANLTASFLPESDIENLFEARSGTVFDCVQPLIERLGDVKEPDLQVVKPGLALLPGDLNLSRFEDTSAIAWLQSAGTGSAGEFRVVTAIRRLLDRAAADFRADYVLVDLAPSLGALNRSALIAADYIVTPLAADLYSLQGLKNYGDAFRRWSQEYKQRLEANKSSGISVQISNMQALGYILQQPSERLDRPVAAYGKWADRIPKTYREEVLGMKDFQPVSSIDNDEFCLARTKNYRSLVPMAMEARLPIFHLRASHGAIGSHNAAVKSAYRDFQELASEIDERVQASRIALVNSRL